MITTLDENDMEKVAKDWVLLNQTSYLEMKHKYIQNDNFKFTLDISDLKKISRLEKGATARSLSSLQPYVAKLSPEEREKVFDMPMLEASHRESLIEPATTILRFLDENPLEMIRQLDMALLEIMVPKGDENYEDFKPPHFEIINLEVKGINSLNYNNLGQLTTIAGWIAFLENPPHIEYSEKYWKCNACGQLNLSQTTPKQCEVCGGKAGFVFSPEDSRGEKVQELYVMENYEDVFASDTNGTGGLISVLATGNNINKFQIGDKIKITGIVRMLRKKTQMYMAIQALNINLLGSEDLEISKDELKQILEISKDPIHFIIKNFASSIVGEKYDIIKESLAAAIAGGSESSKRKNIHILMVGNPGAGKSELLKAVERNSPKAFYVSDASGPGLTASITDVSGSKVMLAGVLPLANNGVACIDELDKMKREDTQALHSAMEQGEFTKAKAGLTMKFATKTSIIAAANPVNSSFDPGRTILEQITLPESLLQRFDIIWILLDDGNLDPTSILEATEQHDNPILKKYFAYIQRVNPDISRVVDEISATWEELRGKSGDLAMNARVLLAMKRIAQAIAKLHLREFVTHDDVEEMKKIIFSYLKYFNFSVTNITTPGSLKDLVWRLLDLFRAKKIWKRDDLLHESAMPEDEFERSIAILKNEGKIFESRNGRYELI